MKVKTIQQTMCVCRMCGIIGYHITMKEKLENTMQPTITKLTA